MRPETKYALTADGVHLAYQVIGEGERDIVIAFGWISNLEILWEQAFCEEMLLDLARLGRVIWFDPRGIGLSDRVADPVGEMEQWAEDVRAVMDAAGSERATIFAHGEAGQMAMLAAATHPDRVEGLVLYNAFARLAWAEDHEVGMPPEVASRAVEYASTQWGTGASLFYLAPSLAHRPGMQEWMGRLERFAASPGTAVAKQRAFLETDLRHVAPLVRVPTLVIVNTGDRYVRPDHGREIAGIIESATLFERDSPDHWGVLEHDVIDAIASLMTGTHSVHQPGDRVLATVLVTDVAGSTRLASEIGDQQWRALRDRFEDAVRRELAGNGGDLVDTAGDGVLATFDGPGRAIRCAGRIRDAVGTLGLQVRSGIHTGEIVRRDGGIAGIAVHIGSRVCGTAEPGEVIVTRTVRDLVAGSGIAFEDRGERQLDGVPDTWSLYVARV